MARVIIQLPEQFLFSTEIPIYISHINYGHHLDNAALIGLLSEARVRFLKSLGYTEMDVEGVGIIVADAAMQYKSEAFHGETLVFEMTPADFNKYGCDLMWQASDKASVSPWNASDLYCMAASATTMPTPSTSSSV